MRIREACLDGQDVNDDCSGNFKVLKDNKNLVSFPKHRRKHCTNLEDIFKLPLI